jgi:hypothetical protein
MLCAGVAVMTTVTTGMQPSSHGGDTHDSGSSFHLRRSWMEHWLCTASTIATSEAPHCTPLYCTVLHCVVPKVQRCTALPNQSTHQTS